MFSLSSVVPWGRSFDEYQRMFALTRADLAGRVLGCGDGPASFNAEATRRGVQVVSCDPVYQFDAAQLAQRIAETSTEVLAQTRRNAHEFVWTDIPSVEALAGIRHDAMRVFLDDFPAGKAEGRYVEASLPTLPFADQSFDLVLCSHFLFLYTLQFDLPFHRDAVRELCRVAQDVRIFPLLALGGQPSPYVEPIAEEFRTLGYGVSIERVPYEFQRGGNQMLRIVRAHGEGQDGRE